ncbi:DNA polymerase III subunit alpha [Clostridium gasigenes]|nr:DNA polymerase III subunit alpha [Clostridium gasigenes]
MFLNPERVSMPDIDSDFCYERRQEVIDYVVEKYGVSNVSQIITFGTMAPRACIRDVGRAMSYSYSEVDRIAKMIPAVIGISIEKALEMNPELGNTYKTEDRVKALIDVSKDLEGLPRHSSTHAAGVVIASKPLVEYVPLQRNDESIIAQFDMGTLEELGLLKMDFLGLRTLTVMSDSVKMIKENRNVDIDLDKIDYDDKEVYKMISEGKTAGVFQLESAGMVSFMKELKPDCLEDIIAGISLYRPGPMAEIPRYVDCKRNPEKVKYETPELEEILDVTYGVMVYQEQVMQIVMKLAGYSMGRSDLVRRAMSKKKHKVMEEERKNFIHGIVNENGDVEVVGCLRNGISEEIGNKIFDSMMDFASYAFNKSHAAAYAVVGYQTAYLMHYYPVETIAAMLNSIIGTSEKVAHYINFAESLGVEVQPPNINESYAKFTVKGEKIKFGMAAIRNVGTNVIDSVVIARNKKGRFESLIDFINKIELSSINKRAVESLIKSGAFDEYQVFRSKLLAVYEKLMDSVSNEKKRNIDGQISLFSFAEESIKTPEIIYPNIKEFSKKNLLAMEKEMTGLYLSGHPLDEYGSSLKMQTSTNISEIYKAHELLKESFDEQLQEDTIHDDERVILGGIISEVNQKVTRNNTMMAFIKLEDLTDTIEVIVFPRTLDKVREVLKLDSLVVIKGRVSIKEDEIPKLICETIEPLEKINTSKIYLKVETLPEAKKLIKTLKTMPAEYRGDTTVFIFTAIDKKNYRMVREIWVNLETDVTTYLRELVGENNLKIVD